jgi:hypothetical protein
VAGQIAELAHETLPREYRSVATTEAKILLIEAGPQVLATFAPKLQRYTRGNRVAAILNWARALTFSKNRPHRTITYEHAQNELAEHHYQRE